MPSSDTPVQPPEPQHAARVAPRHVTVRDGKAGLPFSKGLMATSVMAAGLPPGRAFAVAEALESRLHAQDRSEITAAELRELAYRVIDEEVGSRYAENYWRWQTASHRDVPLIVMVGGTTGVGKSTVATTLANRLGIVRIISTDAVREVMRGIFTREMMPSLHTSSFNVATLLPELPLDADPVISGFREQVHAVSVGVTQLIRRAVIEGTDLIVEGAHVVPGVLALPARDQAIVAPLLITVDDEQVHRNHFVARAQDTRNRGSRRYIDHFADIRKIQDYLRALALERGVPVVTSYSLDATVSRVMELVVTATTDVVPPRPARTPPAMPSHHRPHEPTVAAAAATTSPGNNPRGTRQE
jgi:2-phosphoglycerate kinase